MRALIFLALLTGCAVVPKVPVSLYKTTSMSDETINATYLMAQEMFEHNVGCTAPKVGTLIIKDGSMEDLNRGRNIFSSINGEIGIAIGLYNPETHILYVSKAHPDKPRVLFHEILHFMFFESLNCQALAKDDVVQHKIIQYLTEDYIKRTRRIRDVGDEWLYKELEEYGLRRK